MEGGPLDHEIKRLRDQFGRRAVETRVQGQCHKPRGQRRGERAIALGALTQCCGTSHVNVVPSHAIDDLGAFILTEFGIESNNEPSPMRLTQGRQRQGGRARQGEAAPASRAADKPSAAAAFAERTESATVASAAISVSSSSS